MALFDMDLNALDDLAKRWMAGDTAVREAAPEMLEEGAAVLTRHMKSEAERRFTRHATGAMTQSIKPGKIRTTDTSISIDVYPHGRDSRGVRNALKAAVLHYGRRPNSRGNAEIERTDWVTNAANDARTEVSEAMQGVWDRHDHI